MPTGAAVVVVAPVATGLAIVVVVGVAPEPSPLQAVATKAKLVRRAMHQAPEGERRVAASMPARYRPLRPTFPGVEEDIAHGF